MIRFSKECDPIRSEYPSIQELQLFIERPFERFYSIPESVSIVISLMSTKGWLPWMYVRRQNGFFKCFAARHFGKGEVISVFTGRSLWRSSAAYIECTLAKRLYRGPQSDCPIAYTRARDGMVQVLDSGNCHMLLGGACCRSGSEEEANLLMTDAGEYVSRSWIYEGDELIVG